MPAVKPISRYYSRERKLTDAAVREIREALRLRRENHPKLLAAKYGCSAALIYEIANGKEYRTEKREEWGVACV